MVVTLSSKNGDKIWIFALLDWRKLIWATDFWLQEFQGRAAMKVFIKTDGGNVSYVFVHICTILCFLFVLFLSLYFSALYYTCLHVHQSLKKNFYVYW